MAMSKSTQALLDVVRGFMESPLMSSPVPTPDESVEPTSEVHDAVTTFIILNKLHGALEKRLKSFKDNFLHEVCQSLGEIDAKGSYLFESGANSVKREHRWPETPDEEGLLALLQTREIKPESCFSEKTTLVLDPSKLKMQIQLGKLKQEEVDALRPHSYAIKAVPGATLDSEMESVLNPVKAKRKKTAK